MSFQLGPKVLIVNDADQVPLKYYSKDADGTETLLGAADPEAVQLKIEGFADLEGADIAEVIGSKGVSAQKQVADITLTIPTVVVGEEVIVDLEFISDDLRGEYASHLSDYKKKKSFILVVKAGETATTLAAKLKAQIDAMIDSGWACPVTASAALGVVTLTSADAKVSFVAAFSGSAIDAGNATGAFAVTTEGFSGRGLWDQLKSVRLETVLGAYVEDFKAKQVPQKGAKYSTYVIKKNVSRPDLKGFSGGINSIPSGQFELVLIINESLAALITEITEWLNANVASRTMYTADTPAEVLAGDAKSSAAAVDVTPFHTPLV
jgi:hypothetical protein